MNLWLLLLALVVTVGAGVAMFLVLAIPRRRPLMPYADLLHRADGRRPAVRRAALRTVPPRR